MLRFNKGKLGFERFCLTNRIKHLEKEDAYQSTKNASEAGSILGSTSTHLTRKSNSKRRISEAVVYSRPRNRSRILEPSLFRMLITVSIYFISSTILSYIRYTVVTNKNKTNTYLYTAAQCMVDFYIQTYSVNYVMMEKFMFEDSLKTISFKPIDEFYLEKRTLINKRVIRTMENLYNTDIGENSVSYRGWMDTNMKQVLAGFNSDERYQNDTIAMAGIVNQDSVISFLKRYMNLCDQFMSDWSISENKDQRINLLENQLYNSQIAYSIYNYFGTVDTIYYHVVYPLWTLLTFQLAKLASFVLVVDIVSYGLSIILFTYDMIYVATRMIREFGGRNNLILIVPMRLMIGEYFWKRKIREARELGYFDYS